MSIKQSENPEAFFEKYQFNQTMTKPHPVHKDIMRFEGLEADYVTTLEGRVSDLEKYIGIQQDRVDWLMSRDMYIIKNGLRKKETRHEQA